VLESVKQAKIGTVIPVYKEIDGEIDALEYFAKLSDYGHKKNSMLIEDNEKSFGTVNPCLKITGKDNDFEITPLNALGKKFLNLIKKDFKFCDKAVFSKGKIIGKLTPAERHVSEQEKLKLKTHLDIIRAIAFKFEPTVKPFSPYCGLFGMISYDFARIASDGDEGMLKDPDYTLYFVDNMFVVNHKIKKTYFVANALITDKSNEKTYAECSKTISNYEKIMDKKAPKGKKPKKKELKVSYDMDKDEFQGAMKVLKKHLFNGDILYAAPSRTAISTYNAEPLDIYANLKDTENCSSYINDSSGISISSSAAVSLNVKGEGEKTVELNILSSSKTRDAAREETEKDLDNKYEALLKVDENKIAHNIMLVDAARNDVARVSEPGTRYVDKLLIMDKQTQSLVSSVKGTLNKDLDALHAYAATFNPPVIIGVPKIKAMQLLRSVEKGKRGFSSASVLFITPDKDLCGMAVKPIRIKKDNAYFRINSKVFCNSDDNDEFNESDRKAAKLLDALKFRGLK
jgi:anthranilate synthase component 1